MTKRVLIQCQSITYLYNGLGAIYTKYKDENIDIDVLFTNNNFIAPQFVEKIKLSKYVKNVYLYDYKLLSKISKKIKKNKKTKLNTFIFDNFYKNKIQKVIKNSLDNNVYTHIVYCHETQSNIIAYLKFAYPEAHFIMYGDGSGLLMGANTKLVNPFDKPFEYKFFDEVKPDEIVSLVPYQEDNSLAIENIPIMGINLNILSELISKDEKIQNQINDFTYDIIKNYSNYKNKVLLLTTMLSDPRYNMSQDDQINIYADMLDKYCEENSLVILKLHPTTKEDFIFALKEKCTKIFEFVYIPKSLKEYPVEIYSNLIKELNFIITFLSSSCISLARIYGINTIDAYDVVQKYPLRDKINIFLKTHKKIIENLVNWDEKSLVYKCDLIPDLIKIYENDKNPQKSKEIKKMTLLQKIFSVSNIYSDYGKKKQITIFGIKIKV